MKTFRFLAFCTVLSLLTACAPTPVATVPVVPTQSSAPLSPFVEQTVMELRGLPLEEFFEESYRRLLVRNPDLVIYLEESYENVEKGAFAKYGITNDRFTNISPAYTRETQQLTVAILELLREYDRSALTYDQQIAYDIYEWHLDNLVRGFQFEYYVYPITSDPEAGRDYDAIYALAGMKIVTEADAEDYLARLARMDSVTNQLIERMNESEKLGILPTRYMLERSLARVGRGYSNVAQATLDNPKDNLLYLILEDKLKATDGFTEEQKKEILLRARDEIERTVIPAWKRLQERLLSLKSVAPEETGAWNLPNGEAFYEYWLHSAAMTDLSAEEIHELGIKELETIHAEMRQIAHDEYGYPRDITIYELYKRLREKTGKTDASELQAIHQDFLDKLESKKDLYFNIYPAREIEIKIAYPEKIYKDPSFEDPEPYVVRISSGFGNVYARYEMGSWFYHEITPGHVASQFLLRELDLPAPTFQKSVLMPAYLEGWALYSEQLAYEMGLYEGDPLSNLGRLEFKALRAARLVAETGIHTQKWTLEEAAAYLSAATGRPTPPSEVLRYATTPGHGVSYYIGYLKIMELRQRAQDQLGDKFDIREFHDTILKYGQMPLPIMERAVNDWIEEKRKEP